MLGLVPGRDLTPNRAAAITEYINQRVIEGWRFDFFPEWTVVEARAYRKRFSLNEFIEAGMERYFAADGNYYQALQNQVTATQAPATLVNGTYVENSAWWAKSVQSYQATDWAPDQVLAVGDKRRNPDDARVFQCTTAHTTGATFDATKFGELKGLDKYIAYEQEAMADGRPARPIDAVKAVYRRDPRVFTNNPGRFSADGTNGAGAFKIGFGTSDNGVQVDWRAPAVVWMQFRLRPPQFTTEKWLTLKAYDLADVVFYQGDCYRSLVGNNTSTPDGSAQWELVAFPFVLASFVKRAAFADELKAQKQTDRAVEELEEAQAELEDACDRELAGQGQFDTAEVVTYGA
jgi:hypothetical protein